MIRPPAVSGLFYPASAEMLHDEVRYLMGQAQARRFIDSTPKAIIVPHAGYQYSGPIASSAYTLLKKYSASIHRIVLLGPTHRVAIRGMALPEAEMFATPLGNVTIDKQALSSIAHLSYVKVSPEVHAQEHSLEVQLPFLQVVLQDFTLVPIAVGHVSAKEVAELLEVLWGGAETLIVISSDLSHYLPYETACRIDRATTQDILRLKRDITHEQACGATAINGLLIAARHHHLIPHLLDLRNSGDTAGARDGVVGYAAFAFCEGARHVH